MFTARYRLSSYIKQTHFVKKRSVVHSEMSNLYGGEFTLAVRMKNCGGENNCVQNFIREIYVFD